jgi:hypothetical protein
MASVGPRFFEMTSCFSFRPTVQQDFIQTIRAVEYMLCDTPITHYVTAGNFTATMQTEIYASGYSDTVKSVLIDSAPVLLQMVLEYFGEELIFAFFCPQKDPLTTKYAYLLHIRLIFGTDGRHLS